jgi:hypothetical protein
LKNSIEKVEKNKEAQETAHEDGSHEEMEPTIKKAQKESGEEEKKYETEIKKVGTDNTKK